jgi:hypothetical protein
MPIVLIDAAGNLETRTYPAVHFDELRVKIHDHSVVYNMVVCLARGVQVYG